jgi:cathepsin B
MRFLLLLTLLCVAVVASVSADKIWSFCNGDKQDPSWLLQVEKVELNPPTPKTGAPFSIHFVGNLQENIEGDAFIDVDVSYSGVQLFQGQQKVCVPGFLPCPIKAGKIDQTFTQTVPPFAPPGGPYTGVARLADPQNKTFTCIKFNFMMDSMQQEDFSQPALDDKLINEVNSKKGVKWVSGRNKIFEGKSLAHVQKRYTGAKLRNVNKNYKKTTSSVKALPASFDWRNQPLGNCIQPIRDQQQCGSCWAFAAAESLGDRFCIASNGSINAVLSPQYMVSCDFTNLGCSGGYLDNTWEFLASTGIPTDACVPYTAGKGIVEACSKLKTCKDGSKFKYYKADKVYPVPADATEIQNEIMLRGPVEAGFLVYKDFLTYKSGVYHHVTGSFLGGHAIKIIGWGVSSLDNTPYWIIANSWGESWGMNGFFWMLRGEDECSIESNVYVGTPLI